MKHRKHILSNQNSKSQLSFRAVLGVFLCLVSFAGLSSVFWVSDATSNLINDLFDEEQGERVVLSKDAGNSYSMDCHSFFSKELFSYLLEVEETKTETKNEVKDAFISGEKSTVFVSNPLANVLQKILFLYLSHNFDKRKRIYLFVLYHSWRGIST